MIALWRALTRPELRTQEVTGSSPTGLSPSRVAILSRSEWAVTGFGGGEKSGVATGDKVN